MKISYKNIINYINDKPSIEDLSDKLFQLGHEHEINGDIIDLELTPNRGDCLSINGILRDLNLFYEINHNIELYEKNINEFNFKFENNAIEACPKISFLKIDIESIPKNYNDKIESYFSDLNVKKNNFFTDISNYISYETGQPTHCYESASVQSGLKLDFLKKNEKFKTLLDKTIEINKSNLVFFNSKDEVVNFAGIIGGHNSSCNEATKSVILECAYFVPEFIIGKNVQHSLNSEAAHKFERGVDHDCHDYVIRRFIKIVSEHANIINIELFNKEYISSEEKNINLNINKINRILGTEITEKDCIKYLECFGFTIKDMLISVPSHRNDIVNINDIAEEIARAIGYNNINSSKFKISCNRNNKIINTNEMKLKNLLIKNGFHEVINDPFTAESNEDSIEVDNPLDSSRKFLRTSLKKSLLENLLYNERRQQDSIKLFEISDIYNISSESSKRYIGIIMSGRVDHNYIDYSKKLDKKYITNLLNEYLNISNLCLESIKRDDMKSKSRNSITYLEFELDESIDINYSNEVNRMNNLNFKYIPISDYPSSTRDLSFSIKDFSKTKQLQEYLLNFQDELLKEVFIFDYFHNEKKEEIKIGFRLVFQSNESTITDVEVNNIMKVIMGYTNTIEGVSIPGIVINNSGH